MTTIRTDKSGWPAMNHWALQHRLGNSSAGGCYWRLQICLAGQKFCSTFNDRPTCHVRLGCIDLSIPALSISIIPQPPWGLPTWTMPRMNSGSRCTCYCLALPLSMTLYVCDCLSAVLWTADHQHTCSKNSNDLQNALHSNDWIPSSSSGASTKHVLLWLWPLRCCKSWHSLAHTKSCDQCCFVFFTPCKIPLQDTSSI